MAPAIYTAWDNLYIAAQKQNGTTEWLAPRPQDGWAQLNLILKDVMDPEQKGYLLDVLFRWEGILDIPIDACVIGRVGYGGTVVYDRPPGMVELDAFRSAGGYGVAYFTIPVKFRAEAGKTYHITWKNGFKYEVREEP